MSIEVTIGPPYSAYAELVSRVPDTMIYSSPEWASFVTGVCLSVRPTLSYGLGGF